jgi:diguanylate cyclase (GGDEF)-like protein
LGGGRAALDEALKLRDRERTEGERAMARLARQLEEAEHRGKEQAEMFQLLPDLVRQMFAATGRRGVGPLALKLVEQLFHPAQSAIFMARPAQKRLAMVDGHGLPPTLPPSYEVEYGQGRIGYVAENRLTMDDADFKNATALVRRHLEATGLRDIIPDVVAPIEEDGGALMGVLCLTGAQTRQGQEKRILKMVADLTAVAITHVTRLRSTEDAAKIDGLTGVYNKREFQRRLGDELHRAEREQHTVSLLILDIDHFKHYNDTNGHLEGDDVLKKVGQILKGSIREDDVAARYGGEEFVILYPGAGKHLALRLAEGLRHAVESYAFPHGPRQPLGALTISGGVATFPEDSRSGVDLIRCADQALYDAKGRGRNRIVSAAPNYLT